MFIDNGMINVHNVNINKLIPDSDYLIIANQVIAALIQPLVMINIYLSFWVQQTKSALNN